MYHQIQFGCKKISSSVDIVETVISDYMSPHCDLELEDSKPDFLQDTLLHGDASPYQVRLQKVQQLKRYHPDEHSLEFLTFPVTLTVTITDQSNFFDKTTQLMKMCHQTSPCGLICTRWGCCSLLFFLNSVLVSVSVFMTLSTVFHSMNSPNNSPLSHSVLPVLVLPYWSFKL